MVSLKIKYILEFGIKKIFPNFVFHRELLRFKVFVNIRQFFFTFSVFFAKNRHNFANNV